MISFEPGRSAEITAHLGIQPSTVHEPEPDHKCGAWILYSPKDAESDPTVRLIALADTIEPFGERLLQLDPQFHRCVDVVYHVTPQHSHGITGEFDWFRMPATLMRRFAAWNLDLSYETFWFDHPDWTQPQPQGFFSRFFRSTTRTSSNEALQRKAPAVAEFGGVRRIQASPAK